MLVDVQTTDGVYLAKVVSENGTKYTVRYMVYKKKGLYVYDKEEEIDKENVCGLYDPEDTEEAAGFLPVEGGFVIADEDDEYEPSESEDESDEESLVDEDEDEA
jgi:hypothetical protein